MTECSMLQCAIDNYVIRILLSGLDDGFIL